MKYDFQVLNNFMGVGEPFGSIWFVGVEEAYEWGLDLENDRKSLESYKKKYLCLEPNQITKQIQKRKAEGKGYTQIYGIISKIISGLKDDSRRHSNDWKDYRNNCLFQKGSGVFQTNLYPLGKPRIKNWPPIYKTLFGYGKENIGEYRKIVERERFERIKQFWNDCKPVATICFGTTYWDEFRELLELQEKPEEYGEHLFLLYREKKIVMTPFFINHQISWKKIDRLVSIIRGLSA